MGNHIRHILVPTDFSTPSQQAVELARALALDTGASVHLLHVLEEPFVRPGAFQLRLPDTPAFREEVHEHARGRLGALSRLLEKAGISTTVEVRTGTSVEAIVEVAIDRAADMIVMGTHARSGLQHFLIGSVAEEVIRRAPCPVVTTRTPRQYVMAEEQRPLLATGAA